MSDGGADREAARPRERTTPTEPDPLAVLVLRYHASGKAHALEAEGVYDAMVALARARAERSEAPPA